MGLLTGSPLFCDLPLHHSCGLSIDHHQSNKPEEDIGDSMIIWRESPSAARIASDVFSERVDLSDFESLLGWVDKLDSGGFPGGIPIGQSCSLAQQGDRCWRGFAMKVLEFLQRGFQSTRYCLIRRFQR